ncbi:MAG: DUF1822 family protein [Stenomitos rutilans HA7619-LM2]|jgi:hypothetical protein|nr:DUF1822 family protein [Stenomitos rutilans HA7619-LM2]
MSFTFTEPTEWWLEVAPTRAEWQQNQHHSTLNRSWAAYTNLLCLTAILSWIKTEYAPNASSLSRAALDSHWEFVDGFTITAGTVRLAMIPTDETAGNELDVPQEWVDIPSWAADYYLATQVDVDTNTVRVWGYTTHQELKTQSRYDSGDRTYCFNAEDLTRDLSTLWVTIQFCQDAQTKAEVAPLAELSNAQAGNLIQRLGDASVVFPRLAVPFTLWGALIENEAWRQRLYQQRLTGKLQIRLSDWLQGRFTSVWQPMAAVLSPQQVETAWGAAARGRSENRLTDQSRNAVFDISRVKVLDFGNPPNNDQVALLVGVSALDETDVSVGIKISPVGDRLQLPGAVQVRLLDERGNEVGQASAAITETIQLQFSGQPGERFSVEVTCDDQCVTETFEI